MHEAETDPQITARDGFCPNQSSSHYRQAGSKKKGWRKLALLEIMNEDNVNGGQDGKKGNEMRRQILEGLHVA